MQNTTHTIAGRIRSIAFAVAIVFMAAMIATCALPTQALALDTAKCTARPNADSGNDILGAKNTRITWEGQAAEGEQIASVTLTVPEGTTFSLDNARATVLSGPELMTRENPDVEFAADGRSFIATFDEPLAAGAYLRLEIYNVFFPGSGGDMQVTGEVMFADGTTQAIDDIPIIPVVEVDLFEQWSTQLSEQQWVQDSLENKAVKLFFNLPILVRSIPTIFGGFLMAVATVACAFPFAIVLGFLLSLMRMSKFRILRGIASLYVNIVRGTPLFLQIYIAFFGLPLAGVEVPSFPLGVVVLFMNSGAYLCEIFRAGIQSIPKGQFEASRSLGMNGAQTMMFVIVPQTVRRIIPTATSEFILLYKDTSMLAAVGTMEIVMYAKTIVASTGSITPYVLAAVFYLIVTLPLTKLVGILEARLATNDTGGSVKKKKHGKKGGVMQQIENEPETETRNAETAQRGGDGGGKAITPEQFSSL